MECFNSFMKIKIKTSDSWSCALCHGDLHAEITATYPDGSEVIFVDYLYTGAYPEEIDTNNEKHAHILEMIQDAE